MYKVGITGGIGSGKTTCCRLFEKLGVPVYYADSEAKSLMYRNPTLKAKIKELLGSESYHRNGRPNRPFIASKVFTNKSLITKLNALIHPAVFQDLVEWFDRQKGEYALYEAALLVESGSYQYLDAVIVVTAPDDVRIERVMKRDGISKESVLNRMKNQLPQEEKIQHATYIIENIERSSLVPQVQKTHTFILEKILAK